MKIIGGKFKGKNFYMPAIIRPTQNVARKALFDILGHDLAGLTVIDLFAGSGAVGLEALSFGALKIVLVEHDPKCVEVIQKNLELLGVSRGSAPGNCEILPGDAFGAIKLMSRQAFKFDIVFADPPYHLDLAKKTLKTLGAHDIVHANSVVIIQHDEREKLPDEEEKLTLFKRKNYGKSVMSIYKLK